MRLYRDFVRQRRILPLSSRFLPMRLQSFIDHFMKHYNWIHSLNTGPKKNSRLDSLRLLTSTIKVTFLAPPQRICPPY